MKLSIWKKREKYYFTKLEKILCALPILFPDYLELHTSIIAQNINPISNANKQKITRLLQCLVPWRKGPFNIYGINILSEWRSNLKWRRILSTDISLQNKLILDVGCGNGYYMWRMIGAGAKYVIGLDHNILYLYQFEAIRRLFGNYFNIHLLPIRLEDFVPLGIFDIVFSMGVIYHCKSPLDHLYQLKDQLISKGQIIIESLVIDGNEQQCLIPNKTYAKMKNIYFIPSAKMIKVWLEKCDFCDVQIVNQTVLSIHEQRKTSWSSNQSLIDYLHPVNRTLTIEGYPAPLRAIVIAKKK
uniref:tRNA U34 carboxymethyltransferase n=1 Tax=Candidatus Aschnera chinzeii TaxID=1485666 RepID=A0AAT9G4L0_9ENTR|nr:MAG: tRNA 5-methoxyuridine(34)/uridine 5-oxyacetic acid(34) synthase CmoB [Candidatus Aschnera chinzeii]